MSIERTFDLIINAGTSSPLVINANQNDSGEIWKFNLYQEDGTKVIPAAGEIVGLKSDGHAIVNAGTVNESGQVVITETAQITAAPGANVYEIVFDSVHGTANFILYVEKSPVDDDADFSESDISAIQQAIAMAIDAQTVAALQNGLAQESATRAAQDAQLAGNISEEAATRAAADAVLRQAIDDAAIVPAGSTVVVDNTLSIAGAAADAKKTGDAVSDLNQALSETNDNFINYCYEKTNDISYAITGPYTNYAPLNIPLKAGKEYLIEITLLDFTDEDFGFLVEIGAYRAQYGAGKNDVLFTHSQLIKNGVNKKLYVNATYGTSFIGISFGSVLSVHGQSVKIVTYDTSAKFADKETEIYADNAINALKTIIGFNDIDFEIGNYQNYQGVISENQNFMISDFIKIIPYFSMEYFIHGYNHVGCICVFKDDKTTLTRSIYAGTEQDLEGSIIFEEGEAYVRFCRWSTSKNANDTLSMQTLIDVPSEIDRIDDELAIIGESQWKNKIWHCFGTSISNANQEGKYPPYITALSGLQYVNFAYSGGKLTQQILNQIKADSSIANADLITVEGFVNDWSQGSQLGTITDTTSDTFYGAMYEAITYILSHSNATLVFITDTTGQIYTPAGGTAIDIRREAIRGGHTQNEFIEATIKMCNYMGVPVIDAGRKSCISQDTAALYLVDQIHQTEKGGEQYAQTIWAELKNIKPRIK